MMSNEQTLKNSFSRRDFLKCKLTVLGLSLSPYYLVGCGSDTSSGKTLNAGQLYKAPKAGDFTIKVEGNIPSDLKGTLYRNGPSLFERDGFRKNHLLDGDGYITKLQIDGKATLKGEYVKTDKFIAEEAAGKFINDTFTTIISNSDNKSVLTDDNDANKSSVSVRYIDGKLYSFEESLPPYEIDTDNLSAKKSTGFFQEMPLHSAHGKHDVKTGDFINFGVQFGDPEAEQGSVKRLHSYLHVYVLNKNVTKMYRKIPLTGLVDNIAGVYMHDFFVTPNYIVFNVQPLLADLTNIYPANVPFGKEEKSLARSFTWKAGIKNKLLIISRLNPQAKPLVIEAPSTKAFWHTINAYETNPTQINVEFIGYQSFDFFSHKDPLSRVMREGKVKLDDPNNSHYNGLPTRYQINLSEFSQTDGFPAKGSVEEQILTNSYYGEFPMINPAYMGSLSQYFYQGLVDTNRNGLVNGLGKFNAQTKDFEQTYFLPEDHICGEAVFCAKSSAMAEDDGYLITTAHDLTKEQSFVAIFDAKDLKKGPVTKLHLDRTLPYRLHGEWVGQ